MMKKIILAFLVAITLQVTSQTSISLFQSNSTVAVLPNQVIYASTLPSAFKKITVDLKNIGADTNTYQVKRYDMKVNWIAIGDSARPSFCFAGQCYGTEVVQSMLSVVLSPGQNSGGVGSDYLSLDADITEGSVVGYTYVKFTIFNEKKTSDSVQFSIKYNDPALVGINTHSLRTSKIEIFPNPAKDQASLVLNSAGPSNASILLFNGIGEVVLDKTFTVAEGKNILALNLKNLSSGIYIMQIKEGDSITNKKLIIE